MKRRPSSACSIDPGQGWQALAEVVSLGISAIGSPFDQWEGVETITAKRENPKWYPTEDVQWVMGVPSVVLPGPQNPLGPRALYLGTTLYRIHGTNRPGSIGGAVSHGCFRMHNTHIVELYEKVELGASVHVIH
jgi:lipoprotein-anchoring transpeptidase ErfK/SrfK